MSEVTQQSRQENCMAPIGTPAGHLHYEPPCTLPNARQSRCGEQVNFLGYWYTWQELACGLAEKYEEIVRGEGRDVSEICEQQAHRWNPNRQRGITLYWWFGPAEDAERHIEANSRNRNVVALGRSESGQSWVMFIRENIRDLGFQRPEPVTA